jgi:hypothetical protein
MCNKATEFDPFVVVFAKKANGEIEDGWTSHPHPDNLIARRDRFMRIGKYDSFPNSDLNFGKEKAAKLNRWMKNGSTIYVRISYNQIPEVAWSPSD